MPRDGGENRETNARARRGHRFAESDKRFTHFNDGHAGSAALSGAEIDGLALELKGTSALSLEDLEASEGVFSVEDIRGHEASASRFFSQRVQVACLARRAWNAELEMILLRSCSKPAVSPPWVFTSTPAFRSNHAAAKGAMPPGNAPLSC